MNPFLLRFPLHLKRLTRYFVLSALLILVAVQASFAINLDLSRINQSDMNERLSQRPRIILTNAKIAEIKAKAGNPGYKELLPLFYAELDRMSKRTPIGKFYSRPTPREWGYVLPNLALAYKLTGNRAYYNEIVSRVNELLAARDWKQNTDLTGSAVLWGMSCVYDWLYDELPSTLKSKMKSRMISQANHFYNKYRSMDVPFQMYNNHGHLNTLGLLATGMALYGDDPMAMKFYAMADQHLEHMVSVLPPDGAWHEGTGYLGLTLKGMMPLADMVQRARGVDYFANSGWFENVGHFRLHNSMPGLVDNIDLGDSPRFEYFGPTYALYRLASVYRDGVLQGLSNELVKLERENKRNRGITWLDLVWYDETVTPVARSEWEKSRFFSDLGHYYWRNEWNGSEVFWAHKAGPPLGMKHYTDFREQRGTTHAHPDAGQVLLYANGKHLLIDDGYTWAKKSTNHNVPLIGSQGYQRGSDFAKSNWFNYERYFNEPGIPRILTANETPLYSYVVSELHGAYFAATGPKSLLRYFITLYDGTGIVIDSYELWNRDQFSSLLHTPRGQFSKDGNVLKFNAGGNVGFFLRTLSDNPLSVTHKDFTIPAKEMKTQGARICNPTGTKITIKENSPSLSGTIYQVIEPFRWATNAMRWNAQISGGKLLLTNAGDKSSFTIELAGDDLLINGQSNQQVESGMDTGTEVRRPSPGLGSGTAISGDSSKNEPGTTTAEGNNGGSGSGGGGCTLNPNGPAFGLEWMLLLLPLVVARWTARHRRKGILDDQRCRAAVK
jgi:hypothetical protein